MQIYGVSFDMVGKQPIVLLKTTDGNRFLPIWIGHPEAAAILMKLQGASTPRPMTHDLLADVLDNIDAKCERVSVTELRDNTFYATITLSIDGSEVEIDSRPSDALALAVRCDAPIFAAEEVIEESSIEFEHEVEDQEEVVEKFKDFLEEVTPEDFAGGEDRAPDGHEDRGPTAPGLAGRRRAAAASPPRPPRADQFAFVSASRTAQVAGGAVDDAGEIISLRRSRSPSTLSRGRRRQLQRQAVVRARADDGTLTASRSTSRGYRAAAGPPPVIDPGTDRLRRHGRTPDGKYALRRGRTARTRSAASHARPRYGNLVATGQASVDRSRGRPGSRSARTAVPALRRRPARPDHRAFKSPANGTLTELRDHRSPGGPELRSPDLGHCRRQVPVRRRPQRPSFIHVYRIRANGSLSGRSPYARAIGGEIPFGMTITPDGEDLYIANYESATISGFSIGVDGALTDLPGSASTPGPSDRRR